MIKVTRPNKGGIKLAPPVPLNEIYTGKNKKLGILISNNCPKDDVIAFVIGTGSRLPKEDELCELFDHITFDKQDDNEGAMLTVPKGKISKEKFEKLVSQIRNGYFTRKNLLLLWQKAKDDRTRKIITGVLFGLGILTVAAGGKFLASALKESERKNELAKDDNPTDESLLDVNSLNDDEPLKDTYTNEEFFSENNPYPEDFGYYSIRNNYYKYDDGFWCKVDGYWEDGLFHETDN